MRATCPRCEELIEIEASPNRMVSVTCPTCTHQFYTKSPKTMAGSGAGSAVVPPAIDRSSEAESELKLAPETPPSRYQAPPSLPEITSKPSFDLFDAIRSAGSWAAVIGLIVLFGALGLGVMVFAPRFVQVAKNLPSTDMGSGLSSTATPGESPKPSVSGQSGMEANASHRTGSGGPIKSVPSAGFTKPPSSIVNRTEKSRAAQSTAASDLIAEFIELQQRLVDQRSALSRFDSAEVKEYWKVLDQAELQSRALLKRALDLRNCPASVFAKHRSRLNQLADAVEAQSTTKLDALPPIEQATMRSAFSEKAMIDRVPHVQLLRKLVASGFVEVSDAASTRDPIGAKQIGLLNDLNASLIDIESEADLSLVAPQLERAADEIVELAAKRSGMEAAESNDSSSLKECVETQRMLAFQILKIAEKEYASPRAFANAALNFHSADTLFSVAKHFTPEELRKRMGDARREQQGLGPQAVPSLASAMESGQYSDIARMAPRQSPQVPPRTNVPSNSTPMILTPTRPFPSRSFGPSNPPYSNPARRAFEANRNRYSGSNGARILFAKPADPTGTAKRWVKHLGVSGWSMSTSGGQCQLSIPWRGSMELLAHQFGTDMVIEMNTEQRWIRVKGDQ